MFIKVFFILVKKIKRKQMFSKKGLKKLWYILIADYCTVIRNDVKVYFIPMERYYMVWMKKMLQISMPDMFQRYIKILTLASTYFWIAGLMGVFCLNFILNINLLFGIFCNWAYIVFIMRVKTRLAGFVFNCCNSVILWQLKDNTSGKHYDESRRKYHF